MNTWLFWAGTVLIPLLLTELGSWASWLAIRIVRLAARQITDAATSARYCEEFTATIERVPGQISQLLVAIGILIRIPILRRALNATDEARQPPRQCATVPAGQPDKSPADPPTAVRARRLEISITASIDLNRH